MVAKGRTHRRKHTAEPPYDAIFGVALILCSEIQRDKDVSLAGFVLSHNHVHGFFIFVRSMGLSALVEGYEMGTGQDVLSWPVPVILFYLPVTSRWSTRIQSLWALVGLPWPPQLGSRII